MNSNPSNVAVSDFRNAIANCQDLLSIHWHSCVGVSEQINWFGRAFNAFNNLNQLSCKRGTEEDFDSRERVNDKFGQHVSNNMETWSIARVHFMNEFNPKCALNVIKEMLDEIGAYDSGINLFTEALFHFGHKASEMKVREWKHKITLALPERQEKINQLITIFDKTVKLIKIRQLQIEEGLTFGQ